MSIDWSAVNLAMVAEILAKTSVTAVLPDPIGQRIRIPAGAMALWGFGTVNRWDFSDANVSYPVAAYIFEVGTVLATPTDESPESNAFMSDQQILADPNFWRFHGIALEDAVYQVIPGFPSVADEQIRIGNVLSYSVRVEMAFNDPFP